MCRSKEFQINTYLGCPQIPRKKFNFWWVKWKLPLNTNRLKSYWDGWGPPRYVCFISNPSVPCQNTPERGRWPHTFHRRPGGWLGTVLLRKGFLGQSEFLFIVFLTSSRLLHTCHAVQVWCCRARLNPSPSHALLHLVPASFRIKKHPDIYQQNKRNIQTDRAHCYKYPNTRMPDHDLTLTKTGGS